MILDDLTTQLTDFMQLSGDLDLPKLCSLSLRRNHDEPDWKVEAQLSSRYDTDRWGALRDWAVATGGTVRVGEVRKNGNEKPWRRVDVTVSNAGLLVRVWTHVDAADEVPAWACAQPAGVAS